MTNFKPDSQINNVPNQEVLKENLWRALEKVIPDTQHEYNEKLKLIKQKYVFISYEDAKKELGTIDEQIRESIKNRIKGLSYTKDVPPEQCLFMKADRKDGSIAYAVIGVGAIVTYRADFFSPVYFEGHGSNHDYNAGELLGNLYNAVELPPYLDKNVENSK
jgi:hypothetical protein